MLGDYLRLIRLPNLFTVPSNILAGYFSLVTPVHAGSVQLFLLASSSILLYTSGIVFNDYFDIETDVKERPYRPLPSRRIAKQQAFIIAIVSMISGNLIAFGVGLNTWIVSALISGVVIAYDYKLKKTNSGPVAMGLARSLNILLGASPAVYLVLQNYSLLIRLVFICLSSFAYIFSISLLSRKEVVELVDTITNRKEEEAEQKKIIIRMRRNAVAISFLIVFGIIFSFIFSVILGIFYIDLFVNLILFSGIVVGVLFKQVRLNYSSSSVQNSIKYMVTAVIVFDSVFISGTAGLYYGLSVLLLTIPTVLLSRRLYVT